MLFHVQLTAAKRIFIHMGVDPHWKNELLTPSMVYHYISSSLLSATGVSVFIFC